LAGDRPIETDLARESQTKPERSQDAGPVDAAPSLAPPEFADPSTRAVQQQPANLRASPLGDIPHEDLQQLNSLVFVLLKPEVLAAHKLPTLVRSLAENGLRLAFLELIQRTEPAQFEDLYRYSVTPENLPERRQLCHWWRNHPVWGCGPVVALFVSAARPSAEGASLHERMSQIKGPACPSKTRPGQLRFELRSCNIALSLIHSADDPLSGAREFLIFQPKSKLKDLLRRDRALSLDERRLRHESLVARVADDRRILDAPRVDIDFLSVLTHLKRLILTRLLEGRHLAPLERVYHRYDAILRADPPYREAMPAYRASSAEERRLLAAFRRPSTDPLFECLYELTDFAEFRLELAARCAELFRANGLALTDWERLILATSMYYVDKLKRDSG
jgi:nucleoside diphosphate kinase